MQEGLATSEARRTQRGRGRSPWRALLATATALLLAAGGLWFFRDGPGARVVSPPGFTVARFSGSGDQVTDEFRVREGWEIHWQTTGDRFALAIAGDRDFGTVVEQREPGSGVTAPVGSGTFRLEITAEGPWSVRIREGD